MKRLLETSIVRITNILFRGYHFTFKMNWEFPWPTSTPSNYKFEIKVSTYINNIKAAYRLFASHSYGF